jgi:YD repeat-containing protein
MGGPDTPLGEPGESLETWRLNGQGLITSVVRDGRAVYSAQYDVAGQLLGYEVWGREKVENRYDAQGRILETHVKYGNGTRGTFVHAYPGGPRVDLPQLKEPGDEAWVVTHDKYGRVSRIREHAGPSSDIMCNTFEEFRRDKDGRIIWRRAGFAW